MLMSATERRFRAGLHGYVVFSTIFGGLTALAVWDVMHRGPSFWEAVILFAGLWVFSIVWLRTFEIRITDDELIFRTLFGGTKRIHHGDIRKVLVRFDLSGWGGPLRLWVHPKDTNKKKFSINAKVFGQEAIRAVLDLGDRVATADTGRLDDGIVLRTVRTRRSRKTERRASEP